MTIPDYLLKIKPLVVEINSEMDPSSLIEKLGELDSQVQDLMRGQEVNFVEILPKDVRNIQKQLEQIYTRPDSIDSSKLSDITKKIHSLASDCEQIFPFIKEFQECMKLAAMDDEDISTSIGKYTFPNERMPAEIAIAAAQQNPNSVLQNLKNYKITNPNLLFLVAVEILKKVETLPLENQERIWRLIESLLPSIIKDDALRTKFCYQFEELPPSIKYSDSYQKHAGTILLHLIKSGLHVDDLNLYQIKNEEDLLKIIMSILGSKKPEISNFDKLDLKKPEYLSMVGREIFRLEADSQYPSFLLLDFMKKLENLTSEGLGQDDCYKIVQGLYAIKPEKILIHLKTLPISEQHRFEFVSDGLKKGHRFDSDFTSLGIADVELRFRVVEELVTAKNPQDLEHYQSYFFGLEKDQKRLVALVEQLEKSDSKFLAKIIFRLGITDLTILHSVVLSLIKSGNSFEIKESLKSYYPNNEAFAYEIYTDLAQEGYLTIKNILNLNADQSKVLAEIIIKRNPSRAMDSLAELGSILDQEVFYKYLEMFMKVDAKKIAESLPEIIHLLTPEQGYALALKSCETFPLLMEDKLINIQFDDVQKKLNCFACIFKNKKLQDFENPPNLFKLIRMDPNILKSMPYIKLPDDAVDFKAAILDPSKAVSKPLNMLLQTIQKLATNLEEGDQGYMNMVEWVIYFNIVSSGSQLSEKKFSETLPLIRQIVELRMPSMRYLLTKHLFQQEYSLPQGSVRPSEGIDKLTEEHTSLFKLMLRPLYEVNKDKDWSFINILNDKSYLHFQKTNTVLKALNALNDNPRLSPEEKFQLLRVMFTCNSTELAELEKEQPKLKGPALNIELIHRQLNLLTFVINNVTKELKGIKDIEGLRKILIAAFGEFSEGIPDFGVKYSKIIQRLPDQYKNALLIYSQCFNKYKIEHQAPIKKCFKEFLKNLLDGNFENFRYGPSAKEDINWAKVSSDPKFVAEWRKGGEFSCKQMGQFSESEEIKSTLGSFKKLSFFSNSAFLEFARAKEIDQDKLNAAIKDLQDELKGLFDKGGPSVIKTKNYMSVKLNCYLLQLLSNETKGKRALLDSIKTLYVNLISHDLENYHVILNGIEKLKSSVGVKIDETAKVIDTDDWTHLLLMGTQTESCQSIFGKLEWQNRALLSFVIEPSNRMIAIVDKDKQILARAVMRIMFDDKGERVLYLERSYMQASAPGNADQIIINAAILRAQKLNIRLEGSHVYRKEDSKADTKGLAYLGGRAPFNYVDTGKLGEVDTTSFEFPALTMKYLFWDPKKSEGEKKEEMNASEVS